MLKTIIGLIILGVTHNCWSKTLCPQAFADFIEHFAVDQPFARAHTQFPVDYIFVDSLAQPEPKPMQTPILGPTDQNYQKISFPDAKARAQIPLAMTINTGGNVNRVVLAKPDTDWLVTYTFKKHNKCWRLTKVEDFSL